MTKVKIHRVVNTHDEHAKVEFCVERGAGNFPPLIDVSEFYSVCQETADAFCTDAEAEEVMGIVQQALADTRPVDAVPVVRCKGCYYQDKMLCYRICQRGCSPVYVEPEGFCKWGKSWGADDHGGKHEKVDEI